MIKLYFDNIKIAYEERNIKHERYLTLVDNVPAFFLPEYIFKGRKSVPFDEILKWIRNRVFPEQRPDCKNLLRELDLPSYDPYLIAQKTKACLMTDGYWLSFSDEGKFEDTLRFKAGHPGWDIVDGKPALRKRNIKD